MNKDIGIFGLGRMGSRIAGRLLDSGFHVLGYNRSESAAYELMNQGLEFYPDIGELVSGLPRPRFIWIMLPAGRVTSEMVDNVAQMADKGDCIVDGGNSYYRDSMVKASELQARGLHFIDMGVSGGIWGRKEGFGLMFGASNEAAEMIIPFVKALAPSPGNGWIHAGPSGAGHYTKMVHNAIEYGIMQAYAEGFDLLRAKQEFDIDVGAVSQAWRKGTVIRSWLLDLAAIELENNRGLENIKPFAADSGEARWAVKEGIDLSVPLPSISASLFERFRSRDEKGYQHRVIAVLRKAFGGHSTKRVTEDD